MDNTVCRTSLAIQGLSNMSDTGDNLAGGLDYLVEQVFSVHFNRVKQTIPSFYI